ncbi:sugar transferase [Neobacillus vireti]|uniref:sugar transferase n=1 Tax=Neobacillus vireti TaxID=220686 RepID=UPI002FFE3F58
MKRLFDFVLTFILFVSLFPIFLIIAFLVKLKLGSPIIFKQQRPGLSGKPFFLYKFRTMTDERDKKGHLLPDSVRLTGFGKFLRKYSLDEYPQLINVLKGDISLVGPRPLLMEYLPLYTEEQFKRHTVKPGITGWAQVNGRNSISWEEKFELDVWYVNHHCFLLDLKILFLTIYKVVKKEGIAHKSHVTMPVFKGNTARKDGI